MCVCVVLALLRSILCLLSLWWSWQDPPPGHCGAHRAAGRRGRPGGEAAAEDTHVPQVRGQYISIIIIIYILN